MGGKITHQLTSPFNSALYNLSTTPCVEIDKIYTSNGVIDIVNIDKLITGILSHHKAVVPLNNVYSVSGHMFTTTEINKGIYMLTFTLCGMYINATLQMVTETCGILRHTNGRSFEIAGVKYRVKNWNTHNYKPLLLSNSNERLLVHRIDDPLDIRQVKSGTVLERIDLWDYDTSNKLLAPHLFRLEIEGKLIHNK
jgi:hypothetical protein